MAKRTASAATAAVQDMAIQQPGHDGETKSAEYSNRTHLNDASNGLSNSTSIRSSAHLNADVSTPAQPKNLYHAATPYTYPDPSNSSVQSYPSNSTTLGTSPYPASDPTLSQQSINSLSRHPSATAYMYKNTAAAAAAAAAASYPSPQQPSTGPLSWKQWAQNTVAKSGPQEFLSSANALIALGGRDGTDTENGNVVSTAAVAAAAAAASTTPNSHPAMESSSASVSNPTPLSRVASISGGGGTSQISDLQTVSLATEQPINAQGQSHIQAHLQAPVHGQDQAHAQARIQSSSPNHAHFNTDAQGSDQVWPLMVFDIRQDGPA